MSEDEDERLAEEWYETKTALMVKVLGEEHDIVMHAIIPYAIGGALDLYYFPKGVDGTAIVTKELSEMPGEGSSNTVFDTYEFVMFTRHPISLADAHDESTLFGLAHQTISSVLNRIAPYSAEATLNPNETCEFPEDMESVGGKCLIFDAYGSAGSQSEFGLLAVIEIHRLEMDYAREQGGENLIKKLRDAGYYPYSDLDRPSVV